MSSEYKAINFDGTIPDVTKPFHLSCAPSTDVWDKPPSTHSFNAPVIYRSTTVSAFKSARVNISADWKDRYDQGGLCLVVHHSEGRKWVKSGIEVENGQVNIGTVATERWSDWSLLPIPGQSQATIELSISKDGSLWAFWLQGGGKKIGLREVTWWMDLPKDAELWVGVYAAKPAPSGETGDLGVHFEALEIVTG